MAMTPWVTRLIFLNAGVFLLQQLMPGLSNGLALIPVMLPYRPWTIITYMFLHGGFLHIFFNMLMLFFFGPQVEARLGSRAFVGLYFTSGISAAIASVVLTPHAGVIGASGAVFGVMLAFAMYWPRAPIYIWGVLPIEARWLILLLAGLELFHSVAGTEQGIAHFAHLGGIAGSFAFLKWTEWRSPARRFKRKAAVAPRRASEVTDLQRWHTIPRDDIHPVNREELDRILDKIGASGLKSLTPDELAFLERFSTKH